MSDVKRVRESNLELLRLVAIAGIVFHHLLIKGAGSVGYIDQFQLSRDGWAGVFINSLVIGGVNCFILITGWFGVNSVVKSVVRLLVDCCVFGIISYLFLCGTGHMFDLHEIKASMDFSRNWFIVSYMMLVVVAPILEASLKDVSVRTFVRWLVLLSVFNLYFGYHLGDTNPNGYCVVNFIYLYYIARFLRITQAYKWVSFAQRWSSCGYLLSAMALGFGFIFLHLFGKTQVSLHWFAYNSPLVLSLSIFEFLFFTKLRIKSGSINLLATGVFGTFILHTTYYVVPFRNEIASKCYSAYGYFGIAGMVVGILLVCLPLSVVINRFNAFLVSRITNRFERVGLN